MLTRFHVDRWKSFGSGPDTSAPIAPLTLLVGPNASGKSNFLDALRFLQGLALDLPIADVLRGRWEGAREIWPGIRGGVAETVAPGGDFFGFQTEWLFPTLGQVVHNIVVEVDPEPSVEGEYLGTGKRAFFDTHAESVGRNVGRQAGGALRAAVRRQGSGKSLTKVFSSVRSILGQLQPDPDMHGDVFPAAEAVRDALRGARFLDIQPATMRGYEPETEGPLLATGKNLSAVMARLVRDPRLKQDLVDWLSELVAPIVEDIDFIRVPELKDVMLVLVERAAGEAPESKPRRISARSLSDGTLRFLGELVALMTAPPGSLILLEEPDVGLHPSRVHLLGELLEQFVAERQIQVIASTHSPGLLANVSRETLGAALAFARDAETGLTSVRALRDLPHFATLRDSDHLAHLFSTGWIEQAQ